jgi:hypothetical protein
MSRRLIEQIIIGAVAMHSLILGTFLLLWPIEFLGWIGWQYEGSIFFPSQSGVYLLILGAAYLAGIQYRPFAWFLVASKAIAVIFLIGHYSLESSPGHMLLHAALLDGLMGLAVATVLIVNIRRR